MNTEDFDDVRALRAKLTSALLTGKTLDGEGVSMDSVSRGVMRMAERKGLSGEDMMTVLAYAAIEQNERLHAMLLDDARLKPAPPIIIHRICSNCGADMGLRDVGSCQRDN